MRQFEAVSSNDRGVTDLIAIGHRGAVDGLLVDDEIGQADLGFPVALLDFFRTEPGDTAGTAKQKGALTRLPGGAVAELV